MRVSVDARLRAILDEIQLGDKVADIGCDHGKIANLAVHITKNAVFATDISEPSLKKAKSLALALNQADRVYCLAGDGLAPVEGFDIDTVVIAGLGGLEICEILESARERYKKYILVPHRDADVVRRFLLNNGYAISKDRIVYCEGKYYPVIVSTADGRREYSAYEYLFGTTADETRADYAASRLMLLSGLLDKATGDRLNEIKKEISIIKGK